MLTSIAASEIEGIKAAGTYKSERVITSPQAAKIKVSSRQGEVLNFCANNYLGLANHPALVEAASDALKTHGFGMARLVELAEHSPQKAISSRKHAPWPTEVVRNLSRLYINQ